MTTPFIRSLARPEAWLCAALLLAACGGGGGGRAARPIGPLPPPNPGPTSPSPALAGLRAAAAGPGSVRVDFLPAGPGFAVALFTSVDRTQVYSGTPLAENLTGASAVLTGLTDGIVLHFGLAIRSGSAGPWTPVGSSLRARPGPVIYVDGGAPSGGDGRTPATAFRSLLDGLLAAATTPGGANVWVRSGTHEGGTLPIGPGVHAYGGFGLAFDLATRDAAGGATRLSAPVAPFVAQVLGGSNDCVLDGFLIDSAGIVGVDVVDSDVELRALTVRRLRDRGVRLRNSELTGTRRAVLTGCVLTENGADGLSAGGAFDLRIDACRFDANMQEGIDVDDLVAPEAGTATLHVTATNCYGNASEGLDVDLAAPPVHGGGGGRFLVTIAGCRFERNGLHGLLIDQEHEFAPGWHAMVRVLDCQATANRLAGVHVDADATGDFLLAGLDCTANGTDGAWIGSESRAGHVVLARSWFAGNLGAGARASLGNVAILASHCAFAGNRQGGLVSTTVRSSAASCIAFLQPEPWQGADDVQCFVGTDPGMVLFRNAAREFAVANAHQAGRFTLEAAPAVAPGVTAETAGDGIARTVTQILGNDVVLDTVPAPLHLPARLMFFPGSSVAEDLQLENGSPAVGTGMAPPGESRDPGPHGAPGGRAPGTADPMAPRLAWLPATEPAPATGLQASTPLRLTFDSDLDPASVTADRVRVTGPGGAIAASVSVQGPHLDLTPPGTGWPQGTFAVDLMPGLRAADGAQFGTPLRVPLHRP